MVKAHVKNGQLELLMSIPEECEGRLVELDSAIDDDEPIDDLEAKLSEFKALGPAEFEPGTTTPSPQSLGSTT